METNIQNYSAQLQDGFINKRQLAQKLGMSPRTIEKKVSQGLIPCMKIGRTVRFDWETVKRELQETCSIA